MKKGCQGVLTIHYNGYPLKVHFKVPSIYNCSYLINFGCEVVLTEMCFEQYFQI